MFSWKPNSRFSHLNVSDLVGSLLEQGNVSYRRSGAPDFAKEVANVASNVQGPIGSAFMPTRNVLAFDLETTGVGSNAQVLQFAAMPLDKDLKQIGGTVEHFGKRTMPWESGARATVSQGGITDEVLAKVGSSRPQFRQQVIDTLEALHQKHGKFQAAGHNVRFDMEKLGALIGEERMAKYFDTRVIDSMSASAAYAGATGKNLKSFSLPNMAKHFGIGIKTSHNAGADVLASVEVLKRALSGMGEKVTSSAYKTSFQDLRRVAPAALQNVTRGRKVSGKWPWMLAAAGGAMALGMSARGSSDSPIVIEGLRQSTSQHDQMHGIRHSGPGQRRDPFGSGRNPVMQFFYEANMSGAPWLQASSLGITEQNRINDRYLRSSQDVQFTQTTVGTDVHRTIQRLMAARGQVEGTEVEVSDPMNRVYGNIDVLLKGNIPLEIKTVNSVKDLKYLKKAKEDAVSQANFYAIATGSSHAYVLYATRQQSDEYKLFKVAVDHERYRADVARLRHGIQALPGDPIRLNTPALNVSNLWTWLYQPGGFGQRLIHPWRGTAPSPYYSYEASKPIGDYSTMMAKAFRKPHGGFVQHLGNTSQKHAIRSQSCKVPGRNVQCMPNKHPVGSRASRSVASA